MNRLVAPFSLLALAGLFAGCDGAQKQAAAPPPPPQVKAAPVLQRDVPVYIEAIGETRGNTEIEIRARVEGFLETIDFKEGSLVTKGQLLYTIDKRPFEAALSQAKATASEAEAQLVRTHQDVARYEPLVAKNAISREEYDTAVALEKAAKATLEAAKAMQEKSEIDLSYTKVLAPEDGLVGKTEVYAGTLVGRGQSTLLTRISRLDPIHVRVTVREADYLTIARKKGSGTATHKEGDVPFELELADGTRHPSPGRLVFVDRTVDPRTGTLMLEVAFDNPDHIVRPGQYARVRAQMEIAKGAILVPQTAVQEVQGVYNVMVVAQDGTVEQRLVQPGQRVKSLWVIDAGLKPGEQVVVEGLQKIRPGIKVAVQAVSIEEDKPAQSKSAGSAPPAQPAAADEHKK
jgi:membrane fusion protein (multidrug efflux system)